MAVRHRNTPGAKVLKFVELEPAVKAGDDAEDLYPVTLSDGSVDRHGDTVNPTGWDLKAFEKNPVLLWAHDSRSLPIGSVVNVRSEGPALRGEMKFAKHAFAQDVKGLVDSKILRSVSVGFRPVEWKIAEDRDDGESWVPPIDFQKQELLELSIVPIPANPNALIDSKAAGESVALICAWAQKTLEHFSPATLAVASAVRSTPVAPAPVTPPAPTAADFTPEQIAELVKGALDSLDAAERMQATGKL